MKSSSIQTELQTEFPIAIWQCAAIHVQRLCRSVVRIRRANVQAAEFEIRPEDNFDRLENLRRLNHRFEELVSCRPRWRYAARPVYGFKFAARGIALQNEYSFDTLVESGDLFR